MNYFSEFASIVAPKGVFHSENFDERNLAEADTQTMKIVGDVCRGTMTGSVKIEPRTYNFNPYYIRGMDSGWMAAQKSRSHSRTKDTLLNRRDRRIARSMREEG